MARTYVKVGGSWKLVPQIFVKVGGEWRRVVEGYAKRDGSWETIFEELEIEVSSGTNVNLRSLFVDEVGRTPANGERVTFKVPSDAVIGSSSTSDPALTTGDWPDKCKVFLVNEGLIAGAPGEGGAGGDSWENNYDNTYCKYNSDNGVTSGEDGKDGGTALSIAFGRVYLTNEGTIGGGGGGGGGGGAGIDSINGNPCTASGGGGGSGAGVSSISGGNGGYVCNDWSDAMDSRWCAKDKGSQGSSGDDTSGGSGGSGGYADESKCLSDDAWSRGGTGGSGGDLGQSGSGGESGSANPDYSRETSGGGSGGSPGYAIEGYDQLNIEVEGDIRGPTD